MTLSRDGCHDLVAGLIRDSQLELALHRLESMEREGLGIEDWLYDMMIYALVDREEFDQALAIVKRRFESDDRAIEATMWFHLLDRGSMALHVRGPLPPPFPSLSSLFCSRVTLVLARAIDELTGLLFAISTAPNHVVRLETPS